MRLESYELDVPVGADGNGQHVDVDDLDQKWVQITGTFTATVTVQVSLDGTNFEAAAAAVTSAGLVEVPQTARSLRINVSSYSSGQAAAVLCARDSRTW